jgi:hypothetical protein
VRDEIDPFYPRGWLSVPCSHLTLRHVLTAAAVCFHKNGRHSAAAAADTVRLNIYGETKISPSINERTRERGVHTTDGQKEYRRSTLINDDPHTYFSII